MGRRKQRQPSQAARTWCVSQRQWPRALRIAHAQYQLSRPDTVDAGFWRDVLRLQGARV